MFYTKEMIHTEFKMTTQKDERNDTKKSYKFRIEYLKTLKEDMIKSPKYFRDVRLQQINYKILLMIGQHQNFPLTLFTKGFWYDLC